MLTDSQLKKRITFTRSRNPMNHDLIARCVACGNVCISTTGPGELNRMVAFHREKHRYDDENPMKIYASPVRQ